MFSVDIISFCSEVLLSKELGSTCTCTRSFALAFRVPVFGLAEL